MGFCDFILVSYIGYSLGLPVNTETLRSLESHSACKSRFARTIYVLPAQALLCLGLLILALGDSGTLDFLGRAVESTNGR